MEKQPCEIIVNYVLPSIRAQLAKELVNCDISQQEVAEIIGITPAAVSQYIKGKRGYAVKFDEKTKEEIKKLANMICRGETENINALLCHICNKAWSRDTVLQIEEQFDTTADMCKLCERLYKEED